MDSCLRVSRISGYLVSFCSPHPLAIRNLPISENPKLNRPKIFKIRFSELSEHSVTHLPVNDANFLASPPENKIRKKRVFLLDVNPLCYDGSRLSLLFFARWISIFFSQVSLDDPVIAVFDGDGGNDYRRQILPSYKAKRRKKTNMLTSVEEPRLFYSLRLREVVTNILQQCNVPVVKIDGHEADDVIATLVDQVLLKGFKAVIASPDKDFKQLISEDVQIVLPVAKLERWSFYTLKHYVAQHNCHPQSELSLRCILGDEVDGVPGIQQFVPGFGRKTASKLVRKYKSLENLLAAVKIRSVGRNYAQEALTKHADFLLRNYQVLSLKRDIDIRFDDHWLKTRDQAHDSETLSSFMPRLRREQESGYQ